MIEKLAHLSLELTTTYARPNAWYFARAESLAPYIAAVHPGDKRLTHFLHLLRFSLGMDPSLAVWAERLHRLIYLDEAF